MLFAFLVTVFAALASALPRPQGDGGITPANDTAASSVTQMLELARASGQFDNRWPSFPISMWILTQPSASLFFTTSGPPGLNAAKPNTIDILNSEWDKINAADTVPDSISATGKDGETFNCGSLGSDKQLVLDMLVEFKNEVTQYGTENLSFNLVGNDGQTVGTCNLNVSGTD